MAGDMSFEAKFSQLANNQVAERVPSLVDHRVGFQLIDKNDEETKAVGVAAFLVNKLFLYIPVFFIEGDLKGTELLYIYQSDTFVPATDQMVSMLQQEGLDALGKPAPDKVDTVQDRYWAPEEVNISRYPSSFTYKRASLDSGNSYIDSKTMAAMLTERQRSAMPDLVEDLPKLGKRASEAFIATMLNSPAFSNALLEYYSKDDLEKVAQKAVADIYAKAGEPKKDDVIFITNNADENMSALGNSEKKLLMLNGVYILDHRTNFSKVFQTDINDGVLQNPTEPGVYDVLMNDGEYRTFIIVLPQTLDETQDVYRRHKRNVARKATLIDIDEPKNYYCTAARKIFCKPSMRLTQKQIGGLRGGDTTTKQEIASIIADAREDQRKQYGDPQTKTGRYYVDKRVLIVQSPDCAFESDLYQNPEMPEAKLRGGSSGPFIHESENGYGEPWDFNIELTPEEGRLSVCGDTVLIPEGCRIFIKNQEELSLGTADTISRMMYKQAIDFHHITVQFDGNLGSVRFEKEATGPLSRVDVLRNLVLQHGIYAGTAQKLLKEAGNTKAKTKTFLIKHAAAYDVAAYGMSKVPYMQGPYGRSDQSPTFQDNVRGAPGLTGPQDVEGTPILPQDVIDRASQAAGQGIKEVFDTSVLAGLVDVADMAEIRKDYITQMIKGMDSVGRMLFLYYWHKEEFENRYGDIDMKNLENTLRTVFTSTGDLILFLREKTVYHPEFSESMFGALSEDVGTAGLSED